MRQAGRSASGRRLRDHDDGSYERFWEDFRSRPAMSKPDDGNPGSRRRHGDAARQLSASKARESSSLLIVDRPAMSRSRAAW
jgi:hypothetical protein